MLSMKTRLECPHSYADSSSMYLLCDFEGVCDGRLYECCLYERDFKEQMAMLEENRKCEE